MKKVDENRTLEQLEGQVWPEPDFRSTLVIRCHALRKRPIATLSVEDLRLLLGQDIGTPYLLPRALRILHETPLAEGDFFPGDLICAVMKHNAEAPEVVDLARRAVQQLRRQGAAVPRALRHL